MKKQKELSKIEVYVSYMDSEYQSHIASIEIPMEAGPSTSEEGAKGAIPMLLEAAHNRFVAAKDARAKEINAEIAAEEAAKVPA